MTHTTRNHCCNHYFHLFLVFLLIVVFLVVKCHYKSYTCSSKTKQKIKNRKTIYSHTSSMSNNIIFFNFLNLARFVFSTRANLQKSSSALFCNKYYKSATLLTCQLHYVNNNILYTIYHMHLLHLYYKNERLLFRIPCIISKYTFPQRGGYTSGATGKLLTPRRSYRRPHICLKHFRFRSF